MSTEITAGSLTAEHLGGIVRLTNSRFILQGELVEVRHFYDDEEVTFGQKYGERRTDVTVENCLPVRMWPNETVTLVDESEEN